MFHVGDKVERHDNGRVYRGWVVGVFEDFVMVQWESGVLSTLDSTVLVRDIGGGLSYATRRSSFVAVCRT